METRNRVHQISLDWLQRGFDSLILALASPTFPISPKSYQAWTGTYKWKMFMGSNTFTLGHSFIHQLSHIWIDFSRHSGDQYNEKQGD